uniref:Putative secreted protein n=1 Tax=Anopheles triannulatus TaxID=58253 RepID=A0A2M4B5D2_9DIPT
MKIVLLISLITAAYATISIVNITENPITITKDGDAKIIEAYYKILHKVNIIILESAIKRIASIISQANDKDELLIVLHKIEQAKASLEQIKPAFTADDTPPGLVTPRHQLNN